MVGLGMSADGTLHYTLEADPRDVYAATLDPVTGQVLVPPERIAPDLEGITLFAPDFSRDGKYLAYTQWRPNDLRVVVRDLATGRESPTRGVNGYVRWSPDGRSFLIQRNSVISLVNVRTDEVTGVTASAPLDQASGRPLTDAGWLPYARVPGVADVLPQWLPDGETIVYLRRNQRTNSDHVLMRDLESGREKELYQALQIVPVAGGEPRELIRSGMRVYTATLAWTPDGRHLLLAKRSDDPETQFPHELWRIAAGGGEPESLGLEAEGGIFQVRVHPDGRRIVFTSGQPVRELLAAENFLAGKLSSDE